MKKIITAFAICSILSVTTITAFSQAMATSATSTKEARKEKRKEKQSEVNGNTLEQFAADFPGATQLQATSTGVMDKITFTLNGVQSEAYYDRSPNLIGTITIKTVNDLPAAGQKTIAKQYKGYTISKVLLFDDNEANDTDMILYGQQFADADNYFAELTKDGKAIIVQITNAGDVYFFKSM